MDETGDYGFPKTSSYLFILTSIYFHHQSWQSNYAQISEFRRDLNKKYGFHWKDEFHTKYFIYNKNPYFTKYNFSDDIIIKILEEFIVLLTVLDFKTINVVIDKRKIKTSKYDVLEKALVYNVQRIENDLIKENVDNKYMIIVDEGNIKPIRKIVRKIQKFNPIPSKFSDITYRKEVKGIIEDPLTKDSKDSHFIQISDLISFIIFSYLKGNWSSRLSNKLNRENIRNYLDKLANSGRLNLKASENRYGIVKYPK
jgi:hypothetical protein